MTTAQTWKLCLPQLPEYPQLLCPLLLTPATIAPPSHHSCSPAKFQNKKKIPQNCHLKNFIPVEAKSRCHLRNGSRNFRILEINLNKGRSDTMSIGCTQNSMETKESRESHRQQPYFSVQMSPSLPPTAKKRSTCSKNSYASEVLVITDQMLFF